MNSIPYAFYKYLVEKESSKIRIGWFRTLCAIFGGLAVAYTGMTLTVILIPSAVSQSMLFAMLFLPFVWACAALWVTLAVTRLRALLRSVIPVVIFCLAIMLLK